MALYSLSAIFLGSSFEQGGDRNINTAPSQTLPKLVRLESIKGFMLVLRNGGRKDLKRPPPLIGGIVGPQITLDALTHVLYSRR
ncbi:hypothetical protein TNCV_3835691 [Trichonephila clavipes]|nr:hypothetical protein TNCV_3835691 [Trichonephila clavipes]